MTTTPRPPLIIVGASARAAAQSALRAGYEPWCIDLFADRDLRAVATVQRCPWSNYPHGIHSLLREGPKHAPVLLTGAMENHLREVEKITHLRPLLDDNTVPAIELSREPTLWREVKDFSPSRHVNFPQLITCDEPLPQNPGAFLLKPVNGSAGHGIRPWDGQPIQPTQYLQQRIPGPSLSAIYHALSQASDHHVQFHGATVQLIGDPHFGAHDFRYTGSIGPIKLSNDQLQALQQLGRAIVQVTGLRGIFGVDLILDLHDTFWPVEINPRYTASIEVLEAVGPACLKPVPSHQNPPTPTQCAGKAILFAQQDTTPGDLYRLISPGEIADVPDPDEVIRKGHPICTLKTTGSSVKECLAKLREQATRVYNSLHHARE